MIPLSPGRRGDWQYSRGFRGVHDNGSRLGVGQNKSRNSVPYIGFMPRLEVPEPYAMSHGLHGAQHKPLYRYPDVFMWAEDDLVYRLLEEFPGSMFIRKANMVGFDESRMKTFWKFTQGSWLAWVPNKDAPAAFVAADPDYARRTGKPPLPVVIEFNADDARDEMVRFLTNMFGDWHFHLSAQERSLDDAKDYVKRRFAERLHAKDPETYPEVPAFKNLPAYDEAALLGLRKLRSGKPADTATLEQLAWLTECGVRDAMEGAETEAAILAVVEKVTKGVLTAKGFNDTSDMDTFWTIRDGISPVWQHDIIDQGNAYLAAEARVLAGYLNTESHHPAPLAVILAVAASVGGVVHTRSVR